MWSNEGHGQRCRCLLLERQSLYPSLVDSPSASQGQRSSEWAIQPLKEVLLISFPFLWAPSRVGSPCSFLLWPLSTCRHPPPWEVGVEEEVPPRFPLTTAWTAGPLGLGQAPSGAWSRGPRSKPGPWQLLRFKSRGWKVLKVMAGASRLPVSTERFLSQGLRLSLPPTIPRGSGSGPPLPPLPRQSTHRGPEGQAESGEQEKCRRDAEVISQGGGVRSPGGVEG